MDGLTEKEYTEIREELESSARPLFFFHDDSDGLSSFLLLYRHIKEGYGVVVKSNPRIDDRFLKKVEEYCPDKIFIVDIAMLDQEFVDKVKTKIIWIDHHEPQEIHGVKYYNPRKHNKEANFPASYLCYNVVKKDLWIAMAGIIGDWFMPRFADEFRKEYKGYLPKKANTAPKALFESKIGEIAKIFNFILKGKTGEAMKNVKIITRLEHPDELIKDTTSQGRYIRKKFLQVNQNYVDLLESAKKTITKDPLFVFTYPGDKMSFTGELSNEILYKHPEKVLLIAREKSGEMKCSLRTGPTILLPPLLNKALEGLSGYGGGHEHACGACVKISDFEKFKSQLRAAIEDLNK